ncbi:MAG: hypothetical protein AAF721_11665 [Myxococcota bacterium]
MNAQTGVIGLVLAVLAFFAGRLTAPSTVEPPAAEAPAAARPGAPSVRAGAPSSAAPSQPDADAKPLALLERCAKRLARARAQRTCESDEDPTAPDDAMALEQCMTRRDVLAACDTRCRSGAETGGTGDAPDNAGSPGAGSEFASSFSQRVVGVDEGEAEWLEDYLCTVHTLRAGMVDELQTLLRRDAPASEIEDVITGGREERAAVLEDLEGRLGAERYQRLRSVGGLGILGGSLDCAAPS